MKTNRAWTMRAMALLPAVAIGSSALAQPVKDPPWNPAHINGLPAEVRTVVLAMCPTTPNAGHYFATYSHNSQQLNLHFEHFHCEQGKSFCDGSACLHQMYALTAGRYRLARTFYGAAND